MRGHTRGMAECPVDTLTEGGSEDGRVGVLVVARFWGKCRHAALCSLAAEYAQVVLLQPRGTLFGRKLQEKAEPAAFED